MGIIMSGCASITKSTLLGFGTGAVVGGVSGALIDKQNPAQAALTTALIMGAMGGIAGYVTHDALESRDADVRKETLFNLEKYGVSGFSNGLKVKDSNESYYMNQPREQKFEPRGDR